jgi:hypothetical protein
MNATDPSVGKTEPEPPRPYASVFDAEGGGEIDPVTTVGVKVSTPTLTLTASCSQVMKY